MYQLMQPCKEKQGADGVASAPWETYRNLVLELGVIVALPAQVASGCFMNGLRNVAEVGGDVMLEAFTADVLEQLLQLGNLGHAGAAERGQRIVGELARAGLAANDAAAIVG